jgi:3-isopropylmalate/(R)-2-methylmalate dehydratase small subunit
MANLVAILREENGIEPVARRKPYPNVHGRNFFNNCYKSGLLPIVLSEVHVDQLFTEVKAFPGYKLVVNLEQQTVATSNGSAVFPFEIDAFRRFGLLNGLDDVGLTLQKADKIRAFEQRHLAAQTWLANTI